MSTSAELRKNKVGFALVFTGFLFLFNPCVNILDVLPDMFGFLLIYAGLKKQSAVDGYFEDARKISLYLIFVYIAKFGATFLVLSNPKNSLPDTFIFTVLELIFLIPFFHKLFAGFEYTLMRTTGGNKEVRTNEPYAISMIFCIVKCVGVMLVEFYELITQGTDFDLRADAAFYASLANTKKYAMLLCVLVQLILGVIFMYQMCVFFRKLKKHPYYYKELSEKYSAEMAVNRTKHLNNALSVSNTLYIIGIVFVADMLLEGFDILPDVLTALFIILSFYTLTHVGSYIKMPVLPSCLIAVTGIISTALGAYVNPEAFYLLSKEFSMFEHHSEGFYATGNAVVITAAVNLAFVLSFIYAVIVWIKQNRQIYEKELLGNHDRKLLTVGVLSGVSVILKAVSRTVDAVISHMATNEAVSEFISDRPVLTAQRMAGRIAENENVKMFTSFENISFVVAFFAIIFVVFAVFNTFALKAEVVKNNKK